MKKHTKQPAYTLIPKLVSKGAKYLTYTRADEMKFINDTKKAMRNHKLIFVLNDNYHSDTHDFYQLSKFMGLGSPYFPAADSCPILDTVVPDSMDYEMHIAIRKIQEHVGGSISAYVRKKLKYTSEELCNALSAEQVDAVAMAIFNIEQRGQGTIIGDQTGIGKGRIAAALIRYACNEGHRPIFMSEKPNLFSDIYRDLAAIGSDHLVPFIINARDGKTDVKDENGNVIYRAPEKPEQDKILESQKLPKGYDFILSTYSQFNQEEKKPVKPMFLRAMSAGNILIMDEAHNASGSSNTGAFFRSVLRECKGVAFLSATFAKRPDNMPLYAQKTAMSDANMTNEELVESIAKGGVALQEVLSAQLVSEGQMIRRERSFDGVEVNYITLDNIKEKHAKIADAVTEIIRDIIAFQAEHIEPMVGSLDKIAAAEGAEVEKRKGTKEAGVDNTPYFSKVFNVISQMLFSIKAEAVADRAIERLKEGKKPVIAFANTMGSFIDSLETDDGQPVQSGDMINADFKEVLTRGIESVMKYTERGINGKSVMKKFEVSELSPEGKQAYFDMVDKATSIATGITISPIDVIISRIEAAGYSIAEVTGRKWEVRMTVNSTTGVVQPRKRVNTNDAFRQFNNNEVDCLLINQAGSTGASAHAIKTDRVPADKVKQRCMIILQPELNINTEVQKRGRINRTGQLSKPIYDYVTSAIPAEKRMMMMLKQKLKSLDANTTSNQKQSNKILDVSDFLNKYGDKVVTEYLTENPELSIALGDPLGLNNDNQESKVIENAAHKVSGRVAILPVARQEEFYSEVMERYAQYVDYLLNAGQYDLEVETMNLEAETMNTRVIKAGRVSGSVFGEDSMLEKAMCNVLRKPFSKTELDKMLRDNLKGQDAKEMQTEISEKFQKFARQRALDEVEELKGHYKKLISNIPNEKGYQKLNLAPELQKQYLMQRTDELNKAQQEKEKLIKTKADNQFQYLNRFFTFFYTGRGIHYPTIGIEGNTVVKGVFLGCKIDWKKKNPFAPSAVSFAFALSDSTRYIALSGSGEQGNKLGEIIGASYGLSSYQQSDIIDNWEQHTAEANAPRRSRFIVTGNLLQAFSDFPGKLVSFTTKDGDVRKGILMPDNWQPKKGSEAVIMPIGKASAYIIKMSGGNSIITTNDIALYSRGDSFKIISPKRGALKEFYTDQDIVALLFNKRDGFEMVSGQMVAYIEAANMPKLISIMDDRYKMSVKVSDSLYDVLLDGKEIENTFKQDVLTEKAKKKYEEDKRNFEGRKTEPKQTGDNKEKRIRIAKVKAAAKLKLLKLLEV